jgi:ribosomal-protein-serine acetyltransferase
MGPRGWTITALHAGHFKRPRPSGVVPDRTEGSFSVQTSSVRPRRSAWIVPRGPANCLMDDHVRLGSIMGGPAAATPSPTSLPIDQTLGMLSYWIDDHRCLRLLEEVDADELHALVNDNREFLARWMPWAAAQTLGDTLEFIRRTRKQLADNQGFQAAIVDNSRIVGVLGFHRVDWENRATSIGYWIAESFQGRGTVTKAVRALTDHAFWTWQLNRVEIRAGADNERSRAIPTRLGFKHEGVLRQAERVGERYIDHVIYAMLAADWDLTAS